MQAALRQLHVEQGERIDLRDSIPADWSGSSSQWQRSQDNKHNAAKLKCLRTLASMADTPDEKEYFEDLAAALAKQNRENLAPRDRYEAAMRTLAEAKVRRQRAAKHVQEAQEQLNRAARLEAEAQRELEEAVAQVPGQNGTGNQRQQASGANPMQQDLAADILQTLHAGSAYMPDGTVVLNRATYRRLAAQLGVPSTPERHGGGSAGDACGHETGRAREVFNMTPTANSFAALQEAEEEEAGPGEQEDVDFEDEDLAERLRSASHPTSGRRQNSKVQQHRLVRSGSSAPRRRRGG